MDNRQNKNRYLSSQTMVMQEIRNVLFIAAGAVSTTFCAIAAAGGILDSAEGLRSGLPVYFGLLVPSLLLLIFGLRGRRLTGAARRYESIFEGDTNGVLTAEELSARMGKDAASVMDELDLLFGSFGEGF